MIVVQKSWAASRFALERNAHAQMCFRGIFALFGSA
jgi:hypothetical protein